MHILQGKGHELKQGIELYVQPPLDHYTFTLHLYSRMFTHPVRTPYDEELRCRACWCRPRHACAGLLGQQLLPRLWLGTHASVPSG